MMQSCCNCKYQAQCAMLGRAVGYCWKWKPAETWGGKKQ